MDILGTIGAKLCSLKLVQSSLPDLSHLSSKADLDAIESTVSSVIAYLQKSKSLDSAARSSCAFFMSTWITMVAMLQKSDISETAETAQSIIRDSMLLSAEDSWMSKNDFYDETLASVQTKYVHILLLLPLLKAYDRLLAEVLRSLDHSRINSRSKALRVLNVILAKDPGVLANPAVMSSVGARLRDSSALVRDAAVDIVGKYILIKPEVIHTFCPLLCERSGDTGTGVRRRVLRLLKDIYMFQSTDQNTRADIADRFLRRLEDEEEGIIVSFKITFVKK